MLAQYLKQTARLLQNPGAPTSLYSNADLTDYINYARGQIAGEAECCRVVGTIPTVVGQYAYNFANINIGVSATTGLQGVIHVRNMRYLIASGQRWIAPRSSQWFDLYILNNPVPDAGPPTDWCQFAQGAAPGSTGSAAGGSFYVNTPDFVYTLNCSCVAYPNALVDDTTIEAIPYLWTDCVPFFAAYWALLSAQTGARQADAERMYNHYQTFLERARTASNPSVNRWLYQQSGDPAQGPKMQIGSKGAA